MKALKTFSIPTLDIVKNKGEIIKSGEIKKEVLTKLQKSGHVTKPVKRTAKK